MDTTEHTVTVKITDPNKNGKLKIEVSYKDGAAFTNTYEASGSATLSFTKNMKNRAFLDTDWFKFTISRGTDNVSKNAPLPSSPTMER